MPARSLLARLFLMLGLALAVPAAAEAPAAAGIESTITAQIEAFQAHDIDTAFGFAADNIRRTFQTPERFAQMVQRGYPMVWNPAAWRFLALEDSGGTLYQKVLITDRAGRLHVLEYAMAPTGDGWRIRGVQILRPPEAGA